MLSELQVNFVLHECLQLLDTREGLLSQLSMPLLVDFKRTIGSFDLELLVKAVLLLVKGCDFFIDLALELTHTFLHLVKRVIKSVL